PEPGGDPDDVLERRLAVDHGLHARARRQELRGERVGLNLQRVARRARDDRVRIDLAPALVFATYVAERVRDGEALAFDRVLSVDPDDRAKPVAEERAGDVVRQRADRHGQV